MKQAGFVFCLFVAQPMQDAGSSVEGESDKNGMLLIIGDDDVVLLYVTRVVWYSYYSVYSSY